MKPIKDQFNAQDKKHLSYLGSMLKQDQKPEEIEQQNALDAYAEHRHMYRDDKQPTKES